MVLRTNEGNIIFLIVASETWEVGQAAEGGDAREDRIGLDSSQHAIPPTDQEIYLSAAVSRDGVVPQALVRPCNWCLIVIGVGKDTNSKGRESKQRNQHRMSLATITISRTGISKMRPTKQRTNVKILKAEGNGR